MGLLFILFFGFLLMKMPVAFCMICSSMIYSMVQGESIQMLLSRAVAGSSSFTLLALGFFILAGNIMNRGGVTDRIFGFCEKLVGWIPGGLGHANIVASVIFAGMSGSAVADAGGLGAIEIKAMKDAGYDEEFAVAVTGASSCIGPIIPPQHFRGCVCCGQRGFHRKNVYRRNPSWSGDGSDTDGLCLHDQ